MSFDQIESLCKQSFPTMEHDYQHIMKGAELLDATQHPTAEQKQAQLDLLPKVGISGTTTEDIALAAGKCANQWQQQDQIDSRDRYTNQSIDYAETRVLEALANPDSPKLNGKIYALISPEGMEAAYAPGTVHVDKTWNTTYGAPPRLNNEGMHQYQQIIDGINKKYPNLHAELAKVSDSAYHTYAIVAYMKK